MTTAARMRMAAAGGGEFNPLTDWSTNPLHGIWLSDPLWTPPADGAAIDSFRNGGTVGGDPGSSGAARSTYRASTAAMNGQPTAEFAGAQHANVNIADIAQPFWIVTIGSAATGADQGFVGSGNATGRFAGVSSTNRFALNLGATLTSSPSFVNTGAARMVVYYANGASSQLTIDGTADATGNAGANGLSWFHLGSGFNGVATFGLYLTGHIHYVGIFDTNPIALPEWSRFKAITCRRECGINVA